MLGVSNKLGGKYTYYNTKEEIDEDYIRRDIFRQEGQLRAEEQYSDIVQAMEDSFQYENGTYTFTVPSFGGVYFNIKIWGNEEVYYSQVIRSTGYELNHSVKQDAVYYLAEHTEAKDWQEGEQYSFTLKETTYRGIFCTVDVEGGEFKFEIPLTDEAYIADREHPIISYIE